MRLLLLFVYVCITLATVVPPQDLPVKKMAVRPGQVFYLQYTLKIDDVNGATLELKHTGDAYTRLRETTIDFFKGYKQLNAAEKQTYFANDPGLTLFMFTSNGTHYTFEHRFTAPVLEGVMGPMYTLYSSGIPVTGKFQLFYIDITCSDGTFCNGLERLIRGVCTHATQLPCISVDNDPCSNFPCIEETKRCGRIPVVNCTNTPTCSTGVKTCKPDCRNKVCGDDGCGGKCGTCTIGQFCVAGSCGVVDQLGTCANPEELVPGGVIPNTGLTTFFKYGNSDTGFDMTTPYCGTPGINEYVYKFEVTLPEGMGFEVRLTCYDGSTGCDTLMGLHNENCEPFTLTAVDRLCSDDQTPPGNVGSRVNGKLPPGRYTLVVTGYSSATVGPYRIEVLFTPNCYPKCEGLFCGSNGCGGECGVCGLGTSCYFGRCQADPCVPNCKGRACGSDGCGGDCGTCKGDKYCDQLLGDCVPINACDNFVPNCPNMRQGKGPQDSFCASDCNWHTLAEPTPDLVPNVYSEMVANIGFQYMDFPESSCALSEKCVTGSGRRLLMMFDTYVHNIGAADFYGPNIQKNPNLFTWASCHQHYHFEKFARFNLYSADGKELRTPGAKLSYCMEDTTQYFFGPQVPCTPQFSCTSQGIPRGRSDLYPASIDCQWLDITDLQYQGCWHLYEVCTNVGRSIFEGSYENNCVSFPLYIPHIPEDLTGILKYTDVLRLVNPTSFYPGCN